MKAGIAISRLRNTLKLVKEDAFTTDRYLYSLIMKYGKTLVKNLSDQKNLFNDKSLIKEIPCIELIEVDKIEACCVGIKTGCTFRRTKEKLPLFMEDSNGPMIKSVSTLDYSKTAIRTDPTLYANITNSVHFKYNKSNYYWYIEGHIFIPDVDWESIRLSAFFEEDVSLFVCSSEHLPTECIRAQDKELAIPDDMFSDIENYIRQELLTKAQLPMDTMDDKQNIMR